MSGPRLAGTDRRRLRLWLVLFFLALAVPTAVLVIHAIGQLKWEAFHQHRQLAEGLAARIDGELARLVDVEEARSYSDYSFLVVAGNPMANFLQRSPLSALPARSAIPGLIGYFQVDDQGRFSTPLLPRGGDSAPGYGVDDDDRERRAALETRILGILADNRLVAARPPRAVGAAHDAAGPATSGASAAVGQRPGTGTSEPADPVPRMRLPSVAVEPASPSPLADAPAPARKATRGLQAHYGGDDTRAPQERAADNGRVDRAEAVQAQAAFDRLSEARANRPGKKQSAPGSFARLKDLEIASGMFEKQERESDAAPALALNADAPEPLAKRAARKERSVLPEAGGDVAGSTATRVRTFESEIDPFDFSLLDSGHFVLFRKVWRDGERIIQGALVDQRRFLEGLFGNAFQRSPLAATSKLAAAWDGDVLWAVGAAAGRRYPLSRSEDLAGTLLHRERLSAPFADLEAVFTVTRLPAGPGARVIAWVAAVIALVLCGGFALMYRLAMRQLDLARQQQDFVSAVSHELRTPLTSIRMYAEMLRQGWASEEKKATYYAYIFEESERLSRLIGNVLQLARATRRELDVNPRPVAVATLMDGIASKVSSQTDRAGFELAIDCDARAQDSSVLVDEDAFHQILINLVDNAIKFSATSSRKRVEIACHTARGGRIVFSVRDHGPGVARDQMKKIFQLFYRPEGELTRETVGTGIGLALVNELARAMQASVDISSAEPGARFSLSLPLAADGSAARERD